MCIFCRFEPTRSLQVDLHGMLVDEAILKLEHQLMCCGGLASGHPEGVLLHVIVGNSMTSEP